MCAEFGNSSSDNFKLTYLIGTYPLLTTTFIDREIRLLQQHGVELQVISIRRPKQQLSPEQEMLAEGVWYLLPVSPAKLVAAFLWAGLVRPFTTWRSLFYLFTRPQPGFKSRLKTILHFGTGVYAAFLLRHQPGHHLHAHFVDRAATVAMVVSRLLNRPYSVTAHANDIYVDPVLLPEKLAEAKFVATCTQYNEMHLSSLNGNGLGSKLHCIYHGLDIDQYQPPERKRPSATQLLLAVGQLKEKKGFAHLLCACRQLKDQGYAFHCHIVGEGPDRQKLTRQIQQLDLIGTVTLCGALPHQAVIDKYREADIFVLPCITSQDGDRDGIPNVILEAMAMELPVVSTRHSGIPEVVVDGVNGLLVPPADDTALAQALAKLLDDGNGRRQLGQRGRQTVIESFSVEKNVKRLLTQFMD
ncbi:MAG: colanic acid biosynthesis glycosyltransferase WcaL [Ardenticatenaceae bacterium]|nr:MAG: colanic acid biosynthesis glycosyltransferase WcaL [Ardenticatenaceae bacterium]